MSSRGSVGISRLHQHQPLFANSYSRRANSPLWQFFTDKSIQTQKIALLPYPRLYTVYEKINMMDLFYPHQPFTLFAA